MPVVYTIKLRRTANSPAIFAVLQRIQQQESFKNAAFTIGMKPAYLHARSTTRRIRR
jgi:siderophore synthetase component